MLISNVLFECDSVSAFTIPPGTVSLSQWLPKTSIVWRGSVRLLEEEQTSALPEAAPYMGLRLKLELYNKSSLNSIVSHFRDAQQANSWAEVWFNPFLESGLEYKISNDGVDTILMTPESTRYYKVVLQLPDTGYFPLAVHEKGFLLQVALGLQFEDLFNASSFSDSMALYKRHFRNFQEKFCGDAQNSPMPMEDAMLAGLTLPSSDMSFASILTENGESDEEEDDDEFGSYIGTSL